MSTNNIRRSVVRIQSDKLCLMLGVRMETNIPRDVLEVLRDASLGSAVTVCNKEVVVSAGIKALVGILISKGGLDVV